MRARPGFGRFALARAVRCDALGNAAADLLGLAQRRVAGALVIIVVAEMFIGSQDGLGHSVFEAQQLFDMPRKYAAIFAAGALGYGPNLLFLLIERRFVHWSGK